MTRSLMKYLKPATLIVLLVVAITFPFVFDNPTYTTIAIFALAFAAAATGPESLRGLYWLYRAWPRRLLRCRRLHPGDSVSALAYHRRLDAIRPIPPGGTGCGGVRDPTGAIALRTRRHTFVVVVTIATFFVLQLMSYNLRGLTNGSTGIKFSSILEWGAAVYNLPFYYVALVLVLVALVVSWFYRSSKFGLGLLAIRDDEDRARGLGVRTGASKLIAFVISAVFAGMAGALISYYVGNVQPTFTFDALFDVAIALMVFHGRHWNAGRADTWRVGAGIGAAIYGDGIHPGERWTLPDRLWRALPGRGSVAAAGCHSVTPARSG